MGLAAAEAPLRQPGEVGALVVHRLPDEGGWRVGDPAFRTSDALFLANMLAIRSDDGRTDIFLPDEFIGKLSR